MKVAYVGNFSTPHSTESHVALALETNGHEVVRFQEQHVSWDDLAFQVDDDECDFVLWTTTYDYAPPKTFDAQRRFLADVTIPTVGYHLDLWWGLDREHRIHKSPFFRCDLVCTADGGHDEQWAKAGVTHLWMPPAVSASECVPGTPRDEYRSPIAFVGSWQGGYHAESHHRYELVEHLKKRGDCAFWPKPGAHRISGQDLRDLYASVGVAVGDSCMVPNLERYWSDRVPETMGRGALLFHPYVEGINEQHPNLITWTAGDWDGLDRLLDFFLNAQDDRRDVAEWNRQHVLEHHTYEVRMRQLVELMSERVAA